MDAGITIDANVTEDMRTVVEAAGVASVNATESAQPHRPLQGSLALARRLAQHLALYLLRTRRSPTLALPACLPQRRIQCGRRMEAVPCSNTMSHWRPANLYSNGGCTFLRETSKSVRTQRRFQYFPELTGDADLLHVSRQSAYLFGRDHVVVDIPLDHPSCSKQHAVIQCQSDTISSE